MKNRTPTIILTGGGTAGHVTPNLALAQALQQSGYAIVYVGQKSGMEHSLAKAAGLQFKSIPAGKLRRYADWRNISDLVRIAAGFILSLWILALVRPRCVFSKGGFVSCPVVWAAWILRIPIVIHESDIEPGLANRLSLPFADRVCYSFQESSSHLPVQKSVLTGLPLRSELFLGNSFEGREICGFQPDRPSLLVLGGSQGAQAINAVIDSALSTIIREFNVCHIRGAGNLSCHTAEGYFQVEYAREELPHLLAMADLVVSRAGATTIFELLALKKPHILIPVPLTASRGDQILNAQSFKKRGFSEIIRQEELTAETLVSMIRKTYQNRQDYITRMQATDIQNSVSKVAAVIESVAPDR